MVFYEIVGALVILLLIWMGLTKFFELLEKRNPKEKPRGK